MRAPTVETYMRQIRTQNRIKQAVYSLSLFMNLLFVVSIFLLSASGGGEYSLVILFMSMVHSLSGYVAEQQVIGNIENLKQRISSLIEKEQDI